MARRYFHKRSGVPLIEMLVAFIALGVVGTYLLPKDIQSINLEILIVPLMFGIILVGAVLLFLIKYQEIQRLKLLSIDDIDKMMGVEFERYVGKILESQGFKVKYTKTSGDLGVDILATKDGVTTGVQTKRCSDPVSREAISDVVGSMRHYGHTRCLVVTSNYFTSGAKALAESNGCQLIDRKELEKWILDFRKKER